MNELQEEISTKSYDRNLMAIRLAALKSQVSIVANSFDFDRTYP